MIVKIQNASELRTRKGTLLATVVLLGVNIEGDGKGGIFYWDHNSTSIDDNINIFKVNAVGIGRWVRATSGIVDIENIDEIINQIITTLLNDPDFINSITEGIIINPDISNYLTDHVLTLLNVEVQDINADTLFFAFDPNDIDYDPVDKYTVEFESNGGSSTAALSVNHNSLISRPTGVTRAGYTLVGWFKDIGLVTQWDFSQDKVEGNITLYAKWELGILDCELPQSVEIVGNFEPEKGSIETYTLNITGGSDYTIQWSTLGEPQDAGTSPSFSVLWKDTNRSMRISVEILCGEDKITDFKTFSLRDVSNPTVTNITGSSTCQ